MSVVKAVSKSCVLFLVAVMTESMLDVSVAGRVSVKSATSHP